MWAMNVGMKLGGVLTPSVRDTAGYRNEMTYRIHIEQRDRLKEDLLVMQHGSKKEDYPP
jgi:hypothetical protein